MKKILITGAAGQLGRALAKEYKSEDVLLVLTEAVACDGMEVMDITDPDAVSTICEKHKPDVIINCAAATNVDGCEADEAGAYRINAEGVHNLAMMASEFGSKFFQISTDYVFSGSADEPYLEDDTPDPVSAYGRTKLAGEREALMCCSRTFLIRTEWLYGEGHNFVRTMLKLAESRDEVSVVDDQIGSPTSAKELARLIHYLEGTENFGIYHGTCRGQCSWADLAETVFEITGKAVRVERISSEEYKKRNPKSAFRPAYSVLSHDRLDRLDPPFVMKEWRDALEEYLK